MEYNLNGINLNIEIKVNKRQKNIKIKIKGPNEILITAPYFLNEEEIIKLINKHSKFILKYVIEKSNVKESNYVHFLGHIYNIKLIEDNKYDVVINNDDIEVHTKNCSDYIVEQLIYIFYKNSLIDYLKNNFERIKIDMNINFKIDIEIKKVKTYFGMCIPKKKKLIFSSKLAKYDTYYIDSVIYHELAHFYYPNHQKEFYDLLESKFKNYKKVQHKLRQIRYNDKF